MERQELCFPQLGNLSCRKPESGWSHGVFWTLVLYSVCTLTVLLNLLVITSVGHFRRLRTPTNLLLLSLAVSDLLVGLLVWPGEIYLAKSCWALGDVLCSLYNLVSFTVTSASVGHVVLVSAERYVAICRPLRYNLTVTVKRIQLCVCVCWFCSLLVSAVLMREDLAHPGQHASCYGQCLIHLDYEAGVFDLLVTFVLPLITIVVLYSRVFAAAMSQARAARSRVACGGKARCSGAKKSELKAARTLGVLVLVFLMCFCPYYCVLLAADSLPTFVLNAYYLNSCVNPLIYAWFYPWFRAAVKHLLTLRVLRPGSRGGHAA